MNIFCVEVLLPSQSNGGHVEEGLPNHTITGQALSSKLLTSIVHILTPETDNCPPNQRKGNDRRKYFQVYLHERFSQHPDHQSDMHPEYCFYFALSLRYF